MTKTKPFIRTLIGVIIAALVVAIVPFGCKKAVTKEENLILNYSESKVTIGIDKVQKLEFSKNDNHWVFDGLFSYVDKSYKLVGGEEDGKLFRFNPISYNHENPDTILDNTITEINLLKDEKEHKQIEIVSPSVKMVVSVDTGSNYIKREAVLVSRVDNELAEGQLGFSIRTKADVFNFEKGFIATRSTRESQQSIPYAFPALFGELEGDSFGLKYSIVIDRKNTSEVFDTARRRAMQTFYEIGAMSSNASLKAGVEYKYIDYLLFTSEDINEYDLVKISYQQLHKVMAPDYALWTHSGNRPADSYYDVVNRLYDEVMDARTGYDKFLGGMTPYGWNTDQAWGEAFAALDALKGMMRYALWLDDEVIIENTIEMIRKFVITHDGNMRWIEPYTGTNAKPDELFFNNQYFNNQFGKNDAGEETGNVTGISTWKYYDRVINLGELALLTQDQAIIDGYLSLMPFVRSLTDETYFQPVAFYYDTREPATGIENGGSGGGAAMWGYTQLLAYELSKENDAMKATYLKDAIGSLTRAHDLGLYLMFGVRNDLKPTSIGWTVRGLTRLYELTEDENLLVMAKNIAQGIFHFYYADTNPGTYFPTYGFGYADNRERWEAYLEMATSLWLTSNILSYIDDQNLLGLYYNASNTHLWALPINGYPYGNPSRNYDDLDGYYIPFEFSTGTTGDNPAHDGGSQSEFRQIKQIYGSGEVFLEHQLYEAWGRAIDGGVMVLNTSSAHGEIDKNNQTYRVFNATFKAITTPIMFTNFPKGNFEIFNDGNSVGVFSSKQLSQGVNFTIDSFESHVINIVKTDKAANEKTLTTETTFTYKSHQLSTVLSFGNKEANHYMIEISDTKDFYPSRTKTLFVQDSKYTLNHDFNIDLFIRVTGIDALGNALKVSSISHIETPSILIGTQDDFTSDTIDDWQVDNLTLQTDEYMGIAQMVGPRQGTSSISKLFKKVNIEKYPFIEVRLVSKNHGHSLAIKVKANDKLHTIKDNITIIEGRYIFDLSTVITGDLSSVDVEVIIEATGQNRSFAIDRVRFYADTTLTKQPHLLDSTITSEYAQSTITDRIKIKNDLEQTIITLPTVEVNFNPVEYPILTSYYEKVRAGDNITFTIKNGEGVVVYEKNHFLPTKPNTPISINLVEEGITASGFYEISYELNTGSTATVHSLSLQGSGGTKIMVNHSENWENGLNAMLDSSNVLRLKPGSTYPYGEIKKTTQVDLTNAPILNIKINQLQNGAKWALKVQPQGVAADMYLILDNANLGEMSVDLRQVISGAGMVEVTFKLFIIAPNSSAIDSGVVAEYISFGNSISLVSAPTDQVISNNIISYGKLDLSQKPFIVIDVEKLTKGAQWRLYVRDVDANRAYELKTNAEVTYPNKYNRSKLGAYIFDIRDVLKETRILNMELEIRVYGDGAELEILHLYATSENLIPVNHYIK